MAALARPSLAPSRSTAGFLLREFSHGAICLLPQVTAFAFADYNGENTWHDENSAHTHFSTGYLLAFLEDFGSLDAAALPAAQRQAAAAHPLLAVRRDMHTQPPGTTSTSSTTSTQAVSKESPAPPPPTPRAASVCTGQPVDSRRGASVRRLAGCGEAIEGVAAVVHCQAGTVITHINFASYGTPHGVCGAYATDASCHAAKSEHNVQEMCLGKERCEQKRLSKGYHPCRPDACRCSDSDSASDSDSDSALHCLPGLAARPTPCDAGFVPATTAVFGHDPCYGRTKRLAIHALCSVAADPPPSSSSLPGPVAGGVTAASAAVGLEELQAMLAELQQPRGGAEQRMARARAAVEAAHRVLSVHAVRGKGDHLSQGTLSIVGGSA
eukprot:COSAG01_NODE_17012_length_1185_cov_0.774401_1_plen_383_part_00